MRAGGLRANSGIDGAPPRLAAWAGWPVLAIAGGALVVLMAVSHRYGYHRDELYFVEASKHMAWGYVDQPPLSVALVWVARGLFGDSLVGLRLFPALADGALVVLTALLARELGGGRFPQTLSALGIAVSPFLVAGHVAGPTIYDFVAWAIVSLLVLRILRTGNDRLWLAVGLTVGVALQNKETILFMVGGLAVGFMVNRQWSIFRSPWLWAGAAVAVAIWSPNLYWQARHGWPSVAMSASIHREHSGLGYTLKYPLVELLLPGAWMAPVWMAGLWALWREDRYRDYRAFAVAFGLLFVGLGLYIGDRPYYVAPLYMVLIAAGALVTEGVVVGTRRFFSERPPGRRLVWRSRRAAFGFVGALGILALPLALPILPATVLATVPLQDINYNLGENIGWPEFAATVAHVYRSLPASERPSASIVTANYGEAGAVDRYGPALGLPRAYSGHNSYWWWGHPPESSTVTIAVGFDRSYLATMFRRVRPAAVIHNPQGVQNDEEGTQVWVCTGRTATWASLWPGFRHYG